MSKTKKSTASSQPAADKLITIIVTVLPPKRGLRTMIVSAAREGEMPLVIGGPFSDRHHLLDQAYAQVMRREPQVVTVKESKPAKYDKHGHKADVAGEEDIEKTDQLVEDSSTEQLPAIEGDDVPAGAGDIEKFEAQLSDISSPAENEDDSTDRMLDALNDMAADRAHAEVNDGEQD